MKRPIRITYMIDMLDSTRGGTENQLVKMINGLNKNKFDIHLICFNSNLWFEANKSLLKCGSKVIKINKFSRPYTYINFLKLATLLRDIKPDVVHTFFPAGNIVGVLAARLAGVKNIVSSRRDYGEWMNRRYLLATRFANRFVRKIITNSNMVKRLTEEKEYIYNGKVEVIYNGIDIGLFNNITLDYNLKRRLNIPGNNKIVGIIANFRPMKHHYTFIKAANEILQLRNDVSFLLIGAGPRKTETERLAHSLNIGEKITFVGPQNNADVISYLSIMDIGVNCSKGEGLSNAVMEYMASGVPCVVSNAGGNPDLITHNNNGYTFELDDYKTLASLILNLLDDEETRKRFIKNAREKIEGEMSMEAMLANYEALYEKMARGG